MDNLILHYRATLKWSQKEAARWFDVSIRTWQNWENQGSRAPKMIIWVLERLIDDQSRLVPPTPFAGVLNCTEDELMVLYGVLTRSHHKTAISLTERVAAAIQLYVTAKAHPPIIPAERLDDASRAILEGPPEI